MKSPQSNLSNGFHRIAERGGIQDTFCIMQLPASITTCTYAYWSVQAIDHGYLASGFSTTDSVLNSLVIDVGVNDTIFPYDTAQLSVNNNACNATYSWSPISTLDNPNMQSPKAYPMETTTYYVTVTEGSISTIDSVTVFVEHFTEQTGITFTGVGNSSVVWGDYDNDGDLDILLTGSGYSKIYKNNGNNSFTEQTGITLTGVYNSCAGWGDYDNDGDLDILLAGYSTSGNITKIYKNNGNNSFTEQSSISLSGVSYGSVAWVDYDNDGDLDIFITGYGVGTNSKIYRNDGPSTGSGWIFTEQTGIVLAGVSYGSVAWGDYDNDGYLDILLTGSSSYGYISKVYKNDGPSTSSGWTFIEQTAISLTGIAYSSVAWGDYDADGDLDILIAGQSSSGNISKIYKNNGPSTGSGWIFTEQSGISLLAIKDASIVWGDYDNNGKLDILMTGTTNGSSSGVISKIFKNNGNNSFTEQTGISLTGVYQSSAAWGDYDNDGDLDIFLTGKNSSNASVSKIYKNNITLANLPPATPTGLTSLLVNNEIVLNWNASSDNNTAQNALTYNLVVGKQSNKIGIKSPHSNTTDGYRRIVQMGNAQLATAYSFNIYNFSAGEEIIWSVQTLDNNYEGSPFSIEDTIDIPLYVEIERTDTISVCPQSYSLNVKTNYDTSGTGSLSYQWSPTIGLSDSTIRNPIASHIGTTTYTVTVTSTESFFETDTIIVSLSPNPTSTFSLPTQANANSSVSLNYTGSATTAANYNWNFAGASITSGSGQGPYQLLWISGGNKQLNLVVSENGCTSTTSNQSIIIVPISSISLTDSLCKSTSTNITYSGSASSSASYAWNFDGGQIMSGSGQGPYSIKWNTDGDKHLSLTVTENGVSSLQYLDSIYIKPLPQSNFTATSSILVTDTAILSYTGSASISATYNWNLGGGSLISGSGKGPLKVKWSSIGSKSISLVVTGVNACNSTSTSHTVQVKPTAYFSIADTGCVGSYIPVSYNGSATSSATYNWNWGSGTVISGTGQGPYQIVWNTSGTKTVSLSVTENGQTSQITKNINIIGVGLSSFSITDSVCVNSPATVTYTASASPNASFNWNFGSGVILSGTGVGPYQVYWTTLGNKYVSLTVNDNGCNSTPVTNTIIIKASPTTTFSLPLTAPSEDTVVVNYTGNAAVTATYNWNFGGGSIISGTGQGPYGISWHTSGVKTVSLSVTGLNNCTSQNSIANIQISASSSFTVSSPVNAGYSSNVVYTGSASSSAIYNWNFDGGTIITGSGQGPYQISWMTAGVKNLSLSVTENSATSSQTNVQVTVKPTANFNLSPTVCQNDTTVITYQGSAGASANYNWNFNGGIVTSGSGQGPYQIVWNTSGIKYVSLTVTENSQSNQILDSIQVIPLPSSSFSITDSVCVNTPATISYTGSANTYSWNFGSGVILSGSGGGPYQVSWTTSGNKYVTLIVNDNGCNSVQTTNNINIKPLPTSSFSLPLTASTVDTVAVNYTGNAATTANYNWNFGGGSIISGTGQGPYGIRWLTSGIKNLSLTVTGLNSCISASSTANIQISPSSSFTVSSPVNAGYPSNVIYTGSASSSAIYNWNFDGGTIITGSGQGPYQISWMTAGVKNLSLSVTENSATSSQTNVQVTVKPTANFILSPNVCQNDTTVITYQGSAGASANYNWNFNGGIVTSGSGQGPYLVYWYSSGAKIISLTVINNGIPSDAFLDTIIIHPIPSASFNATSPVITGDTCLINYTGSSSSLAIYNWNFINATQISGSGQGPYELKWDTSGVKPIKLIVTENGCSSQQMLYPVMVNPSSEFTMDSATCVGSAVTVTYIGQALPTAVYNWNFGGGQIISGVGQGPYQIKWNSSGTKSISLTVYENGLNSNQTTHSVIVNALPSVTISQNNEICLYDSILLTSTINSGQMPISYLWSSMDTTTTIMVSPVHDSTFYLNITDANGCQNVDSTIVIVAEPYSDEEICLVTVDSATVKNVIVWQKTGGVGTDLFKIYKESTVINVYDSIGFRPYDSLSYFIDVNSQPNLKSAKYKISVVDSCGNESAMSVHHTTMHLTINKGIGWSFNLIWTPYEGFQVQTYRIWRWRSSTGWLKIDSVSGSATTYTDNPPNEVIYYIVEIIPPHPCNATKINTNYNSSRSNQANNIAYLSLADMDNEFDFRVFPNPYTDNTNIVYKLTKQSDVKIEVYSALGKKVALITDGLQNSGSHNFQFTAKDYGFTAGIYYLFMKVDDEFFVRKLIEVR